MFTWKFPSYLHKTADLELPLKPSQKDHLLLEHLRSLSHHIIVLYSKALTHHLTSVTTPKSDKKAYFSNIKLFHIKPQSEHALFNWNQFTWTSMKLIQEKRKWKHQQEAVRYYENTVPEDIFGTKEKEEQEGSQCRSNTDSSKNEEVLIQLYSPPPPLKSWDTRMQMCKAFFNWLSLPSHLWVLLAKQYVYQCHLTIRIV